jgi:mannose-6-phosphate isomerase-like protein (cupin superfamily)
MRAYDLEKTALVAGGEYVLGMKDLHTHACYMIYGVLQPGERDREVRPGEGHEEIMCAVTGPIVMHQDTEEIRLEEGHAVHVKEDQRFTISNPTDRRVVYIMAGGHCRPHH